MELSGGSSRAAVAADSPAERRAPVLPVSIVIPAYNAERTLGRVLDVLAAQEPQPAEVIVVDDGSTDRTAELARSLDTRVMRSDGRGFAGAARNTGWDAATQDVVVFMDSDVIPDPGWTRGLARALEEFPGAIVGCARRFRGRSAWGWVAHLQTETPYLALGEPREVKFVSSYCMAIPRELPLRFDSSYGGEDGVFSADALALGARLVFDPRFTAFHDHDRQTFAALRRQQRRGTYSIARVASVQQESRRKAILPRFPLHYFALLRLVAIYRRVHHFPELRAAFLRYLPQLVVAEWTCGASAVRWAVRRPPVRGQMGAGFR